VQEEHDSFRDLADRMLEEKDMEISRLSSEIKNLQHSPDLRPKVRYINPIRCNELEI